MARMMGKSGGLGSTSKEERLMTAANLHIRLGNVQRYCELMVELGHVSVQHAGASGIAPANPSTAVSCIGFIVMTLKLISILLSWCV